MYYKVLKQIKNSQDSAPELFIVEEGELNHFLHEQLSEKCVLVFDGIDARNLYLLSNDKD